MKVVFWLPGLASGGQSLLSFVFISVPLAGPALSLVKPIYTVMESKKLSSSVASALFVGGGPLFYILDCPTPLLIV